ncbi:MAG TPA: baseplate J/gp47 family protein, partial [Candidatus Obscuribacterales bacterium]
MSFQPKKFDQIYAEMERLTQERLPGVTDFRVGSVVRTMYESIAYEMAVLYEQMNQVYLSAYVDTAEGTQLDRLVAVLGIQRGSPDFAEGVVTFERDPGPEAIAIPSGTLITTQDTEKSPRKPYKTIEAVLFPADQATLDVKVQAVNRGEDETVPAAAISIMPQPIPGVKSVTNAAATQFTGKRAETDSELRQRAKSVLLASGKASPTALEAALLILPGVKEVKLRERFDQEIYGLVDVFVDGVDFDNQARVQTLQSQIDQVRAAGVMVRLQSAVAIALDAVFWLEVKSDLSAADRETLETNVQDAVKQHLIDLKMGQPLLFAQLVRQVLGVAGVNNLERFAIATYTPSTSSKDRLPQRHDYSSQEQRIVVGEAAKFVPRHLHLHIGSEPKLLPVVVEFQAADLTPELQGAIATRLATYFSEFEAGTPLERRALAEQIAAVPGITFTPESLKLFASPWSSLAKITPERIEPSIAEKVTLAEPLFVYSNLLSLIGAIKFRVADTVSAAERQLIKAGIRDRVSAYLDHLQPEQSVDLKDLKNAAQNKVAGLTIEPLVVDDFRVMVRDNETTRLDDQTKISVQPFEKPQLGYFCITNTTEPVTLDISTLTLTLLLPPALVQQYELSDAARRALEAGSAILRDLNLPPRAPSTGSPAPPPAANSLQAAIAPMQSAIQAAVTRALQIFQPRTRFISYATLEATVLQPLSTTELQLALNGTTYLVEA